MPLVVAACSNRKRMRPSARAGELPVGTMESVGGAWLKRLSWETDRRKASDLYCGRSVRGAERAAGSIRGALLFASAGLGWIRSDQHIPSYGMTIVDGDDSIFRRVSEALTSSDWWAWLNRHSPYSTSLSAVLDATDGVVVIALPRAYLAMIGPELLALPEPQRARLRIIQRAGAEIAELKPWTIVYDDRLEGVAGHAGTRSDFAARAAVHFAEQVWPSREGSRISEHNEAIGNALSACVPRVMRSGSRKSDAELCAIIADHWNVAGGRTTKLLRLLRDDLSIACEQGRFSKLVDKVRSERREAV